MDNLDILKYRQDAEQFLSLLEKEYYMHFSGKKDTLETGWIYSQSQLFSRQNIDYFIKKSKENSPDKKKYAYLLKFCTENFLQKNVQHLKESIAGDEARCRVEIEGETVPFRYLDILLPNEPDKNKRDRIEALRNKILADRLNPNLLKYWNNLHQQAKYLGFKNYSSLFSYLKGEEFGVTLSEMEELVGQTQDIYEQHFGRLLKQRLGLDFSQSRRSDFAYLKRGKEYDHFFKKHYLVNAFTETLGYLGIDIYKQKNIHFDIETRENKSPRAFCCAARIPQEIYLVIMPSGGQDDFNSLFHEGGHAQHFAHTSPGIDFEYRFLGDNAVTEGYAFLMESLLEDKDWLTCFLGMDEDAARSFIYFNSLLKLWYCRRYAGKLKYELRLHDGSGIEGKQTDYATILSDISLMKYDKESYLQDVDEGFYCTNYIRAWMFEAQLREYLVKKFGYKWHRKKESGDFLREIWSYGQKYDLNELSGQLGCRMDVNFLINSLSENILSYKMI